MNLGEIPTPWLARRTRKPHSADEGWRLLGINSRFSRNGSVTGMITRPAMTPYQLARHAISCETFSKTYTPNIENGLPPIPIPTPLSSRKDIKPVQKHRAFGSECLVNW